MKKIRKLKPNEKVERDTIVINLMNICKIAFALDMNYLISLIYTKFAFKDNVVFTNYTSFDKFLDENDRLLDEIVESAIKRQLIGITLIAYETLKDMDKVVEQLNSVNDIEMIVFSMCIDELEQKVFGLYEESKKK